MGDLHGFPGPEALGTYFRLMSANGAARVYHAARRVGLLHALPADAPRAARACGLHEGAAGLVLDALAALGVVEASDGRYRLSAAGGFLAGAYQDLGDAYWDSLPEFLKTGVPRAQAEDLPRRESFYRAQAAALGWMLGPAAEAAATLLGDRPLASVLDVGAGSAVWSLALARRDPALRVTALDWPGVLEVARASATRAGAGGRFTTIAGDYHEVALPEAAYDLAIVANVTHLESPGRNVALLSRLHPALRRGGEVAVIDIFPGRREGDLARTLYKLGLALRTGRGRVYSPAELDGMLAEAGFMKGTHHLLPVPPHTMGLIRARKR